ncbi:recombinase family protein [Actinokineospora sp. NBRC 105648]|uniref:recombinase family protein n=1 Tax=Actinokineospora sp. NBRC 105648 TaxID=3032206 RepID=UPI002552A2E0|nr:recombinase family protein [Actinokineospora sp. NBRC 105648]
MREGVGIVGGHRREHPGRATPRYTGRQVWNKQRKDEILLDVEDVALGHMSRMRHNQPDQWVWSDDVVHDALIDGDTFDRVRQVMAAKGAGHTSPRTGWTCGCLNCAASTTRAIPRTRC